jgi:hypothetical protein
MRDRARHSFVGTTHQKTFHSIMLRDPGIWSRDTGPAEETQECCRPGRPAILRSHDSWNRRRTPNASARHEHCGPFAHLARQNEVRFNSCHVSLKNAAASFLCSSDSVKFRIVSVRSPFMMCVPSTYLFLWSFSIASSHAKGGSLEPPFVDCRSRRSGSPSRTERKRLCRYGLHLPACPARKIAAISLGKSARL